MKQILFPARVLAVVPAAFAVPVTVTTSVGTQYTTAALTGFSTDSPLMVGSVVTVSFAGGGTASAVWTATGAAGTGFSLSESGDTYGATWTLTNTGSTGITGFTMNGVPGDTTFDIVRSPTIDTPGSGYGIPFSNATGPVGSVSALYTNELIVGGTFYGDEYTEEIIGFSEPLGARGVVTYENDTDNAIATSGITIAGTPEPSSLVLLGTGVLSAAGMLRRKLACKQ